MTEFGHSDVTAVVVAYNSGRTLSACLGSLGDIPAIVVDNASTDNCLQLASERSCPTRIVELETNTGFAAGANAGARLARTPFILFLNPDAQLASGTLNAFLRVAEEHDEFSILGGHVIVEPISEDKPGTCNAPGGNRISVWSMLTAAVGARALFPGSRLFDPECLHLGGTQPVQQVDIVFGACMLVRRDAWERLGGFDERFFMYGEDADLCLRAAALGLKCGILSTAGFYHAGGGSARSLEEMICQLFAGQVTCAQIHGPRLLARLVGPILTLHAGLRAVAAGVASPLLERASVHHRVWSAVWRRRSQWRSGYTSSQGMRSA